MALPFEVITTEASTGMHEAAFKNRKLYCYDVCLYTDEGTKQLFVFTVSIAKVPAQSHGLRTTEDGGHEGDLHLYFDILATCWGIGIAATTASCTSRSAPDTTSSTSSAEEGLKYVSCIRIDIVAIEGQWEGKPDWRTKSGTCHIT